MKFTIHKLTCPPYEPMTLSCRTPFAGNCSADEVSFTQMMRERQDQLEQWKKSRRLFSSASEESRCEGAQSPEKDSLAASIAPSCEVLCQPSWTDDCSVQSTETEKTPAVSFAHTPANPRNKNRSRLLFIKALTDVKKTGPSKLLRRKNGRKS